MTVVYYRIRPSGVVRALGMIFAFSSALSAWFHVRDAMSDGYGEELFWPLVSLVGWRVVCAVFAVSGLLAA
jgi:hypothetical protein